MKPGSVRHYYRIRVEGTIPAGWQEYFGGLSITTAGTESVLAGWLPDTAALQGLLAQIGNLNLNLVSLERDPIENRSIHHE